MKFKEKTKSRVICIVWLITLLVLVTFWWFVCILEAFAKIRSKYKRNYFTILFDAYKRMFKEIINTLKSIKTGERHWK